MNSSYNSFVVKFIRMERRKKIWADVNVVKFICRKA